MLTIAILLSLFTSCEKEKEPNLMEVTTVKYTMPEETAQHEGTWLQWPHNDLYGPYYQDDVEPTWIAMTKALLTSEKVHIIVKNEAHKNHVISVLTTAALPLTNIDFFLFETNDVWVRDNGPVFVFDQSNKLTILDWGFNGWGGDVAYKKCDVIPNSVSSQIDIPRIDLSDCVMEGGAIEHDGNGTMMATRSSVTHESRNPNLTESEIEKYLTAYLGITKFIWFDGVYGNDITDMHIDGFMKFANESTILTMNRADLDYWMLTNDEINTLYNATNTKGEPYEFVYVPLTKNNVKTTRGEVLKMKGSYANYYIANTVVLVPTYKDENDAEALRIIQGIYPNRTVVGIDVRNLYEYGGMIHCVTQQQPKE
jgi:agmatine deiminase